jgi:alpha-beta hydrolase superfamily lysophospholipase
LISIHLAKRGHYRGLGLTSPFLGLALEVSPLTKAFGRVMSRIWPRFSLPSNIHGRDVTHDLEIAETYDRDPLGLHTVTARFFTETERAQREALAFAADCHFRVYCVASGDDKVASLSATQAWFARLASSEKTCEVAVRAYHEVLNETDRQRYIDLIAAELERWTG